MRYDILLAPEAVEDLKDLEANVRAAVRDAMAERLRHQPTKTSKSRIKRLRGSLGLSIAFVSVTISVCFST